MLCARGVSAQGFPCGTQGCCRKVRHADTVVGVHARRSEAVQLHDADDRLPDGGDRHVSDRRTACRECLDDGRGRAARIYLTALAD